MEHILSQNAFWIVNKNIAKEYSIEVALLLSDLVTKQEYFGTEWFFNTTEDIEESTTLSYHKQKEIIKVLAEAGFIQTKRVGMPARQHFKIFKDKLLNFLRTCSKENQGLTNNNKKHNKKNISSTHTYTRTHVPSLKRTKALNGQTIIKSPNRQAKITKSMFNNFWKLYPKKKGRGDAQTSWEKICSKPPRERPTWRQIKVALLEQIKSEQWLSHDGLYIAGAPKWLNNKHWLNDASEMKDWDKERGKPDFRTGTVQKFEEDDGSTYMLTIDDPNEKGNKITLVRDKVSPEEWAEAWQASFN